MSRVVFALLAFIGGSFQIFLTASPPLEAFLFNFIIFGIGFWGIFAFLGHYFRFNSGKVEVVQQSGNLFRNAISFFNLFRGILGILCIWFKGHFWSVTVVISSVFLLSYAFYEMKPLEEIVVNKDDQFDLAELVINFDLFFPITLVILLVVYKMGM